MRRTSPPQRPPMMLRGAPHFRRRSWRSTSPARSTTPRHTHTILGAKRRGLLVDPGAASGLIGSETLRDLLEHCSSATAVRWNKSKTTNVSGISGGADSTLGEIEIPLDISGAEATFKAGRAGWRRFALPSFAEQSCSTSAASSNPLELVRQWRWRSRCADRDR